MIKSWYRVIRGAVPIVHTEQVQLVWALDKALSTIRGEILGERNRGVAHMATSIALLHQHSYSPQNAKPMWEYATKLHLRTVKREEKRKTIGPNARLINARREAAIAARHSGHYWVAACLSDENHVWERAGIDYLWAANAELKDPKAIIDALNKSAECYTKYLDLFGLKGKERKEILYRIHYSSLAALKMEKELGERG